MGQELFQCWRYSSEQIDKSAEMGILSQSKVDRERYQGKSNGSRERMRAFGCREGGQGRPR